MCGHIQSVALPEECADWLTAEIEREKVTSGTEVISHAGKIAQEMSVIDAKIDLLITAYVEQAITLVTFQTRKNALVEGKQRIREMLTSRHALESWFEPALRFIEASKQAAKTATNGNFEEIKAFVEKTGSNLHLTEKILSLTPRDEWQTVATHRSFDTTPVLGLPRAVS